MQLLVTDGATETERARDDDRLRRSAQPWLIGNVEELRDVIGRYQEVGVDELIIAAYQAHDYGAITLDSLDRFIEEVAPAFRD